MQNKKNAFFLLLPLITMSACGIENPYAKHEKKCKANCQTNNSDPDSPRNHPRDTKAPSTDAQYWFNIFESSNVTPLIDDSEESDAAFMTIVRANPFTAEKSFSGVHSILTRFRSDIDFAKQVSSTTTSTTPEDVRNCIKNAFNSPWIANNGTTVNFGKCIPLNHDMFTANAKTSQGGLIVYTEYEKAVSFKTKNDLPQIASAYDLTSIVPFITPTAGSLTSNVSLDFNLNTLILQTAKEVQQKKIVAAVREWSFASLGENSEKPFKMTYDAQSHKITLNGDMLIAQQSAYNPSSDSSFTGAAVEGNKIQISFQDFTITGDDVYPDTQLGFRKTASLGGSYLIAVNYHANKPKHRNYFIQVQGKNAPCSMDAYIVMVDTDGNPTSSDEPFAIDLCASER
jgi:hypothetical protein